MKRTRKLQLALCWLCLLLTAGIMGIHGLFPRLPSAERPIILYCNQAGDDLKDLFIFALSEAKESIDLAVYSLSDHKLIQYLNAKSLEGVRVQVFVDSEASSDAAQLLHSSIQLFPRKALGLMHLKILSVDSKCCWIGTSNWTTQSLRGHGNLVAGLYDEAFTQEICARVFTKEPQTASKRDFCIGEQTVEYWQLPDDEKALDRLIQLIDSAQKSLRISMFTWTHPRIHSAVIAAHSRGVDVQIVMDRQSSRTTSKVSYQALNEAQVPIRRHLGLGLHHYKMAWIDTHTLIVGSANWTRSAFTKNSDCFLVISDLNLDLQDFMESTWSKIWIEAKAS